MKVRFQADADLNRHIIAALKRREPTVDLQTARQAGLIGLEDIAVLGWMRFTYNALSIVRRILS